MRAAPLLVILLSVSGACGAPQSSGLNESAPSGRLSTSVAISTPNHDPSEANPVASPPSFGFSVRRVDRETPVSGVAGRLLPLDADATISITPDEAFAIAASDAVSARFFDEPGQRESAEVLLGRFVKDQSSLNGASLPTIPGVYDEFVAYVIIGGDDVCIPSVAAGDPQSGPVHCTTLLVVDADHQSLPYIVEQMDLTRPIADG